MVIFNSYVKLPEGNWHENPTESNQPEFDLGQCHEWEMGKALEEFDQTESAKDGKRLRNCGELQLRSLGTTGWLVMLFGKPRTTGAPWLWCL